MSTNKMTETQQSRLAEFMNMVNGVTSFDKPEHKFTALTHHLMNYLCLAVADQHYRIIETEIYYCDKANHDDPYVHCAEEQLAPGNWYFNGAGLDITFGKGENIYGGILIRGIKKLGNVEGQRYFSGPSNVLKEIFSNIGNIESCQTRICLQDLDQDNNTEEEIIPLQSVRIGLTKKETDTKNYAEAKYRYIVELNKEHKFKDKEKVIRQLVTGGELTKEQAKEIMGYNINRE